MERSQTSGMVSPSTTMIGGIAGSSWPTQASREVRPLLRVLRIGYPQGLLHLLLERGGLFQALYQVLVLLAIQREINRPVLEGRQDDLLESYSSGMKQKVLIASTVLHEPRLVFLDEPTSRLDPAASALVKELILAMAEENHTTFFICTHMIDFAEDVCDVIGILNDGQLAIQGAPDEIVTQVGARDLEDAYLKLMGGKVDREKLLSWR